MNIPIQEYLRGIFVIKSNVKEYKVFLKMIINHIPTELTWNANLMNLKESQDITKSNGGESKIKEAFR